MIQAADENKSTVRKEIYGVFFAAAALLLSLAFYAPQRWTGPIGAFARNIGLGIMGTAAYIIPAFLIYLAVEYFLEDEPRMTRLRLISVGLILLMVAGIINLLSGVSLESLSPPEGELTAFRLIGALWRHGTAIGSIAEAGIWSGGLIGGLISLGLSAIAGHTGAIIIMVAMMLALAVLIFNVSYSAYVRKSAQVLKDTQTRVGSNIKTRIQNRNIINLEPNLYDELGDIDYLNRGGSHDGDGLDYLETGSEADNLVKYQLPSGNLRSHSDDYPDKDIDYPMYRGELPPNAQESEQISTGQRIADSDFANTDASERSSGRGQRKAGAESADEKTAKEGEDDKFSREGWVDRGHDGNGLRKTKISHKGEQIPLFTEYRSFPLNLLKADKFRQPSREDIRSIQQMSKKLEDTLQSFGVEAKVTNYTTGPTLTRFELTPGLGVKVSKIVNLSDDIALNLAAYGVRIEAPIPGKSAIGIEIPNKNTQPVLLRGIIEEPSFGQQSENNPLLSVIGRDVSGQPIYCDISKMPHVLIAGATGAGKSVCINSILISLLYHSSPKDLRLLLIDPKVVELSVYNGIPHLLQPVVTDPKKAFGVLNWAVVEMDRRYNLFAERQVRDIRSYNDVIKHFEDEDPEHLPLILIVIDELADLMATTSKEVEDAIQRLMAKARAAGIHLIIATQRPSVDVITGVIKANIPSRIAFSVASQVDSRTILDTGGAEKLLGKGDLLYFPQSAPKATRGQGAFVTDSEVESVLNYIRSLYGENYDESVAEAIANPEAVGKTAVGGNGAEEEDELFDDALRLVVETGYASISLLQRRLTIGYPRAARLVDRLHDLGYVGPFDGSKPRKVLISMDQYLARQTDEN